MKAVLNEMVRPVNEHRLNFRHIQMCDRTAKKMNNYAHWFDMWIRAVIMNLAVAVASVQRIGVLVMPS